MALRPIPVERDDEVLFKSIIIGDSGTEYAIVLTYLELLGVGKSCIMLRYTRDEFKDDYTVTIGVDFAVKEVHIDNDTVVKLQIWDTVQDFTLGLFAFTVYRLGKRPSDQL